MWTLIPGVPIGCRSPRKRGPYSMPNDTRQQIRAIARSIKTFGWLIPILVDGANRIIAGHDRYEAGRLLGFESVPVICGEHLTPEQAKAFMLADNRLAEGSDWDDIQLATVLKDLSRIDLDFNIEATGFETAEVDLLMQKLEPPEEQSDAADEFEFAEGSPVSRLGDLLTLGDHRLLCGGGRCRARALLPPGDCIAPDRGVAARVSESAQFLKNPDQRQTFACRPAVVLIEESLKPFAPWANPRKRLLRALVMKLGRVRPDDFAHHLARNT